MNQRKNKFILIFIILLFLLLRLPGLGKDISNTDAWRWHHRTGNFLSALKKGNLKETYQHYQPGLTIMWLNAPLKQAAFSYQYHLQNNEEPRTLENADWYPLIHGLSKSFLVLVLAGVLLLQLVLLRRIFSPEIAHFFGLLIAVEPYLIGIDRWFHLTSLESYFGFTAVLFLLLWAKYSQRNHLIFSGIFYTLALLSKVSALLIVPIFIFVILLRSREKDLAFRETLRNFFFFFFPAIIMGFLLFPALVVDFSGTLQKAFIGTRGVSLRQTTHPLVTGLKRIFFYDLILLYKLSPVTIILFLYSLLNAKKISKDISWAAVLLGFVFYYFFLSFFPKKIDRYVIAMFPYILLLASYGLSLMARSRRIIFLAISILFLIFTSYIYHPVYSAYYSPLFGGASKALELGLYDNSGEYFANAAFYLNSKGRQEKVYVPHGRISFAPYFEGRLVDSLAEDPDYLVISYDSSRKQLQNYNCSQLETSFGNRELHIVYIYRCP